MEDPTSSWQNPSQSFGYDFPQTVMAAKNPFATATHVSPTKSASYRLRWHNSVAEDYSLVNDNGASLKRSASMAMLETTLNYPDQPVTEHSATTPPKTATQHTKKRKQSSTSSIGSTPGKPKQVYEGSFDAVPAPGNPAGKKRRGRPPKNPQPNAGTSQLEFVNEQAPNPGTESHGAASKMYQPGSHSSPVLQQFDSFVTYSNPGLQGVNMESVGDADFQANKYWDASFAGSIMSENNHMTSNLATMAGEIDIVAATSTFDWSLLPTSIGDATTHSVMDPLRPLSLHTLGDSFFHDPNHADAYNFSFAQDPLSASDIISPISVNPNLIFAGQHLGKSFNDDLGQFRPYHQQNLQQQQEQLEGQRKRQEKIATPKAHAHAKSKTATTAAASRPVMRRALTESFLTKSGSKFKTSNVAVHPSPAKQMRSFASGKTRRAVRDENTTPSPTVDGVSVRQFSPKSRGMKRSSRKTKTAVSLSISPGGRAKAETVVIRESETHSERSDSEDNQVEYDTDSSTDEDDLGPLPGYSMAAQRLAGSKSRPVSSSSVSRSMERPKLARFKTAPANSVSSSSQFFLSGDFSSTSFSLENNPFLPPDMSMSGFNKSPRRRSAHNKGPSRHGRNSSFHSAESTGTASHATNLGSMREEDEYSEAETVLDEPTYASQGDAILALKQAVARRNSYCPPGGSTRRPPSSYGTSRPSTRHTNMVPSSPPMQQAYGFSTPQTVRSGYSSDTFNISPTTVTDPDCVTPTTYGTKQHGFRHDVAMDIRCRCSSTGSPEMPVLQCNSCFKWLHVQCEGYGHKPIPPSVVCSFCKGGWQGPQQPQRVFRKPSLPQTTSPSTTRSFQG